MKNLEFDTKEALFAHLRENMDKYIAQKKEAIKYADAIDYVNVVYGDKDIAIKSEAPSIELSKDEIQVKVVINTTNLLDSHKDVHIEGLWKKSLQENKKVLLLREHKQTFDNVISREVVATTKTMSWDSLGYKFSGNTQALIFDAKIKEKQNSYMFEQYKDGNVDNHSVGMRYVNIYFCLNSENKYDEEYKENWDKYEPFVANKDALEDGYFWAVTEAKMVEGSAVLFGSNYATPTLSIKVNSEPLNTSENDDDTKPLDTRKKIDFKNLKFKN